MCLSRTCIQRTDGEISLNVSVPDGVKYTVLQ